jgi:thioredoxin-like negative regulator of GroEL
VARDIPNVTIGKVDVEESKSIADSFNITSVPHVKIFRGGDRTLAELGSVLGVDIPALKARLTAIAAADQEAVQVAPG